MQKAIIMVALVVQHFLIVDFPHKSGMGGLCLFKGGGIPLFGLLRVRAVLRCSRGLRLGGQTFLADENPQLSNETIHFGLMGVVQCEKFRCLV